MGPLGTNGLVCVTNCTKSVQIILTHNNMYFSEGLVTYRFSYELRHGSVWGWMSYH